MPFYRVIVRQDAWINHEGCVEADNAEQAAELALAAWKGDNTLEVPLKPTGESEGFDAAICEPDGTIRQGPYRQNPVAANCLCLTSSTGNAVFLCLLIEVNRPAMLQCGNSRE